MPLLSAAVPVFRGDTGAPADANHLRDANMMYGWALLNTGSEEHIPTASCAFREAAQLVEGSGATDANSASVLGKAQYGLGLALCGEASISGRNADAIAEKMHFEGKGQQEIAAAVDHLLAARKASAAEAAESLEACVTAPGITDREMADAYKRAAMCRLSLGEPAKAMANCKKALSILEEMLTEAEGDAATEREVLTTKTEVLHDLAGVHASSGEEHLPEALDTYDRVLELLAELDGDSRVVGQVHNAKAMIYATMGTWDRSVDAFQKAAACFEAAGGKDSQQAVAARECIEMARQELAKLEK